MLFQLIQFVQRFRKDNEGVTAIEYGLIAALIAVAIITALLAVQGALNTTFTNVATEMNNH